MKRRGFLEKAAILTTGTVLGGPLLSGCSSKGENEETNSYFTYPKGWTRNDKGGLEYKTGNGEDLSGKPIDFEFTDVGEKEDKTFSAEDMKGKRWITAYVFGGCGTGVCPSTIASTMQMHDKIEEMGLEDKVGILLVGIDPALETPSALKLKYPYIADRLQSDNYHLVSGSTGNGMGLAGINQDIFPFIQKVGGVSLEGEYDKSRTNSVMLGKEGKFQVMDPAKHSGVWDVIDERGQLMDAKAQHEGIDAVLEAATQGLEKKKQIGDAFQSGKRSWGDANLSNGRDAVMGKG